PDDESRYKGLWPAGPEARSPAAGYPPRWQGPGRGSESIRPGPPFWHWGVPRTGRGTLFQGLPGRGPRCRGRPGVPPVRSTGRQVLWDLVLRMLWQKPWTTAGSLPGPYPFHPRLAVHEPDWADWRAGQASGRPHNNL